MTVSTSALSHAVRHLEQGDWQAAHSIVQRDASPLGCWAHGIVHLMEGDLENAHYWYRRARRPLSADVAVASEVAALKRRLESELHETLTLSSATTHRLLRRDGV
jgi:hypothetical protein